MGFFSEFFGKIKQLPTPQKIIVILITLTVFLVLIFVVISSFKQPYTVLFKGLTPEEAAIIKEKLKEKAIPFHFTPDLSVVLVPYDKLTEAKLYLAEQNALPEGTKGWFQVFGKKLSLFEMTKKIEDERIRIALEGEIARTIEASPVIESARVHIAVKKSEFFNMELPKHSAAVYLRIKRYKKLTPEQVKGIRNLVANATAIKPENVKVFDQNFNELTATLDETSSFLGKSKTTFEFQKKIELDLQQKIQTLLNSVLGPGNAVTRVAVVIDFNKRKVHRKKLAPPIQGEDKGIPVSVETISEKWNGKPATPIGVPGTGSNIPEYKSVEKNGGKYERAEQRINYDQNLEEEQIEYAPEIKRITVSVFVNSDKVKLDEKLEKEMRDGIKLAAGIDEKRGDSITIVAMKFAPKPIPESYYEERRRRLIAITVSLLLSLLLILAGVITIMWLKKKRKQELDVIAGQLSTTRTIVEEQAVEAEVETVMRDLEQRKEKLIAQAEKDPEGFARLIELVFKESI